MRIQQTFIALLCALLASQQTAAVVNNGQTNAAESEATSNADTNESGTKVADSVAASSDKEATRREAPLPDSYPIQIPHEVYGPPQDSYLPPASSNPGLPVPVYGVPDSPASNNIVYPGPPPDVPPPLPNVNFGNLPKPFYGPPLTLPLKYGVPFPKPQKPLHHAIFNKPKLHYGPPRPQYGPPKPHFKPKPFYGPPKPNYGPPPKPFYGPPPKPQYGPPPKQQYGPPLKLQQQQIFFQQQQNQFQQNQFQQQQFQQQQTFFNLPNIPNQIPKDQYGPPPKVQLPQIIHAHPKPNYGPPEPVPHGPPHPGAPAPPTPPEIKYDGWQPIPGLISRPPGQQYGVPNHAENVEVHLNGNFVPPPPSGHGVSSLSLGSSYGSSAGISDSYGAPLNTVTGSGGIVSSSGEAHSQNQEQNTISLGLSAAGLGGSHDNHLSVIKSIGYEIFPHGANQIQGGANFIHAADSYASPPLNSFSQNGPYAASHSYNHHGHQSSNYHSAFSNGLSLSTTGIGLIPPSGVYGVPPSGNYGTPLVNQNLNVLDVNPPKRPVVFREPVPHGLLESIGHNVAQKDAAGIIESSHSSGFSGPSYIPPPILEPAQEVPKPPTTFFSLPHANSPISFQSVNSQHHNAFHGQSFAASLGSIDTSYGVPQHNLQGHGLSVSLDTSLPPVTIDLTQGTGKTFGSDVQYDCSAHKSQPLPPLTYGVPSASSYTASLASLTTNIGSNQYSFGSSDLQAAHTQQKSVHDEISANTVEEVSKEQYGKSLAESFAPGGEVIRSESIDLNNIPVQGALGSYTLQIQAADGAAGTNPSSANVPHHQLLSDGLLQSIIDAIEPHQHQQVLVQPELSTNFQLPSSDVHLQFRSSVDDDAQQSVNNQVVITAPATEETPTTEAPKTENPLQLIENNEIALYFNANHKEAKEQKKTESSEGSEVRNGQQYGSFA